MRKINEAMRLVFVSQVLAYLPSRLSPVNCRTKVRHLKQHCPVLRRSVFYTKTSGLGRKMEGTFCLQNSVQGEAQDQQWLKPKRSEVWRLAERGKSQPLLDHLSEIKHHTAFAQALRSLKGELVAKLLLHPAVSPSLWSSLFSS